MERRINGHTRLYALIGSPVGHSGSPAMYNYSFEKLGIDAAYLAFDIPLEKTKDAIDAFRTLNVGGFNITMPNKTAAAQLVDRLSPAAELVGACNTVVVEEDKTMTGHITDGIGFVRNLKEQGVGIEGKKIVLLGTGGAATAIAVQAALDKASEIAIFNRKDEFFANGEKTVEKIKKAVPSMKKIYIEDIDDEKKEKERLEKQAQLDSLTGVYNAAASRMQIIEELNRLAADQHDGLMLIDIDDFKHINDSYGHLNGDKVLCNLAQLLKNNFDAQRCLIGRPGGDEFVVYVRNTNREELGQLCEKLLACVADMVNDDEIHVSVSIGAAIASAGDRFETIYQRADEAMYNSKRNGRNCYEIIG